MSTSSHTNLTENLSYASPRKEKLVDDRVLEFLERTLVSIKAEMAAGTPVDPATVADLEGRIEKIKALK